MSKGHSKEEMMGNAKRQRLSTLLDVNCSRSATVVWIALVDDARRKVDLILRPALPQTTFYHFHISMILRSDFL